jgi:hypothetical protein
MHRSELLLDDRLSNNDVELCVFMVLCRRLYNFGKGNVRMLSNPCSSLGLGAQFGAWRHQRWAGLLRKAM